MNCEQCQELISDLIDGSLSREDESILNTHLEACLGCQDVRGDLHSIVSFCEMSRETHYLAPPNERALWLRIRNMVEAESPVVVTAAPTPAKQPWTSWFGKSWELSLPQLAAFAAAIVLIVSLTTAVGVRRWQSPSISDSQLDQAARMSVAGAQIMDRMRQQQQMIEYWNNRVEVNKARWSPQMRATFDRNLKVIDEAVSVSLNELSKNPHDEVSEEMLNAALNEKLAILKEFADL